MNSTFYWLNWKFTFDRKIKRNTLPSFEIESKKEHGFDS